MKKLMNKIPVLLLMVAVLVGCDDDTAVIYDQQNGQTLAQFSGTSLSIGTPEEGASATTTVLVSTVASVDREIEVEVDASSTATPDQYSVSNLMIPAGEYSGEITITSNYEALPEEGSANLVLNLVDIAGTNAVVERAALKVEFFRECAIEASEYVGDWEGPGVWAGFYGDYQTEVVTSIDADGDLVIEGLVFQWLEDPNFWGETILSSQPVKMTIDSETGDITIAEQPYVTTLYAGAEYDYSISATGKVLNACEKTIEIYPVLNQGGTLYNGTRWGPAFVETITLVQ